MKREEAKVGMRVVYQFDHSAGKVSYIHPIDNRGCMVKFDNGIGESWVSFEDLNKE